VICGACGCAFEPRLRGTGPRKAALYCSGRCRAAASRRRAADCARAESGEILLLDPAFHRPAQPAWLLLAAKRTEPAA